jgi:nucleoside-diphosphate-sugar epimerase
VAELERITLHTPAIAGVVLRYGTIYGPGTGFAAEGSTASAVRARKFPVGGGGEGVWSFVHVHDAASATVRAVESEVAGVFNVVDDDPAPVREWLPRYAEVLGAPAPRTVPGFVVRLAAGAFAADQMMRTRGASNRAARETLRWAPSVPSWREGFAQIAPASP